MKHRTRQRHDAKARLARKLRTPFEIREHCPIFQTMGWARRSAGVLLRAKKAEIKRTYARMAIEKTEAKRIPLMQRLRIRKPAV